MSDPLADETTYSVAWLQAEREAERALTDDIMDVLARMVVGWEHIIGHDLAQHPEVLRVSARYREARGR